MFHGTKAGSELTDTECVCTRCVCVWGELMDLLVGMCVHVCGGWEVTSILMEYV